MSRFILEGSVGNFPTDGRIGGSQRIAVNDIKRTALDSHARQPPTIWESEITTFYGFIFWVGK